MPAGLFDGAGELFVQIESGAYHSVRSTLNVESTLRARVASAGMGRAVVEGAPGEVRTDGSMLPLGQHPLGGVPPPPHSGVPPPLQVRTDGSMLLLVVEEAISNALKYVGCVGIAVQLRMAWRHSSRGRSCGGRVASSTQKPHPPLAHFSASHRYSTEGSPISVVASFCEGVGVLKVSIDSLNSSEVRELSPKECEHVFSPGAPRIRGRSIDSQPTPLCLSPLTSARHHAVHGPQPECMPS